MSDYDHTLRAIEYQLRRIALALERITPPPPKPKRDSTSERRATIA